MGEDQSQVPKWYPKDMLSFWKSIVNRGKEENMGGYPIMREQPEKQNVRELVDQFKQGGDNHALSAYFDEVKESGDINLLVQTAQEYILTFVDHTNKLDELDDFWMIERAEYLLECIKTLSSREQE